ncbi:MAG: nitroreductase family protein [Desulfovibrionaceae bacterium]|nr:nitroreductase family protein [Desulfovibrionaceae bacterium]
MPLFTVDPDKCNGDGRCAAECPAGCIEFTKGTLPVPHEKKQAYCLSCGHCVAVCPSGALRLARFPVKSVPLERSMAVSLEQAEQFLKGRRSVRFFKDRAVDEALLARLLSVVEYCPSGHNARSARWLVASTREKVAELAGVVVEWMRGEVEADSPMAGHLHLSGIVRAFDDGLDLVCRHAPALAVAYGPVAGITPREDAVIAITYLDLAAHAAGLGGCWCGYLMAAAAHDPRVGKALGVPDGSTVYGALMLGEPAHRYRAIPPRPEPDVQWLY